MVLIKIDLSTNNIVGMCLVLFYGLLNCKRLAVDCCYGYVTAKTMTKKPPRQVNTFEIHDIKRNANITQEKKRKRQKEEHERNLIRGGSINYIFLLDSSRK